MDTLRTISFVQSAITFQISIKPFCILSCVKAHRPRGALPATTEWTSVGRVSFSDTSHCSPEKKHNVSRTSSKRLRMCKLIKCCTYCCVLYIYQGWTPRPAPRKNGAAPPRKKQALPRPAKLTKSAGRSGAKLTADSIDTPFHYARD